MISSEAEARERSWLSRRTVHDRADILVVHRRARALLDLADQRLVRVSWGAWLRVQRADLGESDAEPIEPSARAAELVGIVEALADGRQVFAHYTGAPRHASDPRIAAIDELAELTGVDLGDLDDRTHQIGKPIDRMLREELARQERALLDCRAGRARPSKVFPELTVFQPVDLDLPVFARSVAARAGLHLWVRATIFEDEPPCYDEPVHEEPPIEAEPDDDHAPDLVVRKALSGVARVDGRAGIESVADLLVGIRTGCLRQYQLERVRTFGALSHCRREWVLQLLDALDQAGLVSDVRLTTLGREVMLGNERVEVHFPHER